VRSRTKVRRPTIEKGKKLKVIARGGVGIDNIDYDYAVSKGIKVVNTPAASSASVAELALAHMFSLARQIVRGTQGMQEGKWEKKSMKGIELSGKTLGLVGVGRIGQELAKRCHCLGMNVIGYDLYIKESPMPGLIKMYNELEEMLPEADFVSLHIPFDPNIGPTIGQKEIDLMKKGSYLINCARGGTVDEHALFNALNTGKIAGAGLDVFEQEPPQFKELLDHPNTTLTPHIGASTVEGSARVGVAVAEVMIEALGKA
jgi:D-3-phosphoglycerate dehydrogenase